MAAVMKMVMDEASSAMLREIPEVVDSVSDGSENWNDRVSGRIGDLVGLVSEDVCWILYFISS